MTAVGFEPTPFRTGALSQRLRPLGQTVLIARIVLWSHFAPSANELAARFRCNQGGGRQQDTLPEWSKGVDSSSTSASCVGSNPTAVILSEAVRLKIDCMQTPPIEIQVPGIEPETFSVLG